jgi:hypothetical protein
MTPGHRSREIEDMLTEETAKEQRLVRTDTYQMSVGEIVGMYDDREIIIDQNSRDFFAGMRARNPS